MKLRVLDSFGVYVTPDLGWRKACDMSRDEISRECRALEVDIRRHLDVVGTEIDIKYREICSHCMREWDDSVSGEPLCCQKAVAEWETQKKTVEALADIFIADSQRFALEPNTLARCCFLEGFALGLETAARKESTP